MKKVITLSLFAIIFAVIFSACSSGTSITKRRYNKGYYVAHTKGRQTAKSESKQAATTTQPKANDKVVAVDTPKQQAEESTVAVNGFVENKKADVTRLEAKKQTQSVNQKSILQKEKNNGFNENPIAQVQSKIREARVAAHSSSDRDGLSLFWIVILVILILWLIGFSVGTLGSLINLLLLIALILLILWLLRVI